MNIGVFFGSRSPEHEVSIITGELIISELKKLGHTVVPVYIDKQGRWLISEKLGSLKSFTTPVSGKNYHQVYLDLESSKGKLVFKKKGIGGKEYSIDLAFPAFHGQNGEDGTIQGFFEIFNIPYAGCDVPSSAIAMDKVLTKILCEQYGFPVTPFRYFEANDWARRKSEICIEAERVLGFPIFVKPARLGSSIGIAKAKNRVSLEIAIEVALKYDNKIILEKTVQNMMDITCAVLGDDDPKASLIQESIFENDLFSYEDKYLNDGGAQLGNAEQKIIIPARIADELTEKIRTMAVDIFKKLGCSGTARIDFLFDQKTQTYYANEINTLPGTLYHHLWKASGVTLGTLINELISIATQRHTKKNALVHSFETDLLKYANSIKLNMKEKD